MEKDLERRWLFGAAALLAGSVATLWGAVKMRNVFEDALALAATRLEMVRYAERARETGPERAQAAPDGAGS